MRIKPLKAARLPADGRTKVSNMFQPRQLLKRHSSTTVRGADPRTKLEDAGKSAERHPAMRGIDVSPVHGRHCICARCEQHSDAA